MMAHQSSAKADRKWEDERRGSSAQRGYGSRWQKARATYLANHPLCRICKQSGIVKVAEVVDHIVPHKGDQALFWDTENWQPLCKQCHDSHKRRAEQSGRVIGCDPDGIPIDKRHHWHRR